MAHFDDARGAVVARILYDGLGTAGKTSSLRALREQLSRRSGEIYTPEEAKGRTLYFDWLELEAGRLDAHPLRVEVMTVPGQWAYAHRRFRLLRAPDAVIAVVDSTPHGLARAAYAMTFLRRVLAATPGAPPPLVVQAHKQDLPDAASADAVRARLAVPEGTAVVPTSAASGEGITEAFVLALRLAREHVRRSLDGEDASTLPRASEGVETLRDRMRAEEDAGTELEGERVLAEVLDEMERSE